jgi:hypothetical protein
MLKSLFLHAFCLLLISKSINGNCNFESLFDHQKVMDSNNKYTLYWSIIENETYIEIGLQVQTLGWIGLGFTEEGFMSNSDIIFTWIDSNNNKIYLEDRYTTDNPYSTGPLYDEYNQNLELISGNELNDYSCIHLKRLLYQCNNEDYNIEKGTLKVIYAFNDEDPISFGNNISFSWHNTNRGSHNINLYNYDYNNNNSTSNDDESEDNLQYVDLLMSNISISSSQDTSYISKLFELPYLNKSHHIINIDTIITDGNINYVHHILLYECDASIVNVSNVGLTQFTEEWYAGYKESSCYQTIAYGWAVGGDNFSFPSHVGLLLSNNEGMQYVILEIHYDNSEYVQNIYDSSGIRLWYTENLRQYSAGMIFAGIFTDDNHIIPNGISEVINYGYCTSECTKSLSNDSVQIFASTLHAHTKGIALRARHIDSNGNELSNIDVNWNYDFNYQQSVLLNEEITFHKGDSIITECYYQTTSTSNWTYGGESTKEEMCLVLLYVYPKPNISSCGTMIRDNDLSEWYSNAITQGYLNEEEWYYNISIDGALEFYEDLWFNYSQRYEACITSNGWDIFEVNVSNLINLPYYTDYDNVCSDDTSTSTLFYTTTEFIDNTNINSNTSTTSNIIIDDDDNKNDSLLLSFNINYYVLILVFCYCFLNN